MSKKDIPTLKLLIQPQNARMERVGRFLQEHQDDLLNSNFIEQLQSKKNILKESFNEFQNTQLQILLIDSEQEDHSEVYESMCHNILSLINLRLAPSISNVDTFSGGNSSDNNTSALLVKSSNQISCSKLPNIEIPNFDGRNLNEFKPFYEIFRAVIDKNENLSDEEKLFYLRSYLKGEALSLINSLPIIIFFFP